ncbi:MAG: lipoprotein insertase outer membrane protein LolB, partial [Rubrivivax sp.]
MHPLRRAACAALLALLLSACATPRPPPPGSDWLAGRLSVQVRSEPPRQLSSAFELRGDAEQGQLQLTSPLGSVVASASWAPGRATLVSSEGTKQYD